MSHFFSRGARSAALALSIAGFGLAGGVSTAGATDPATQTTITGVDTGKYYVFRTRDTNTPATNEQNTRCNRFFGLRALTTITRLNAQLFSYEANPATARISNQTANLLGPGFICAAPNVGAQDQLDAYAYSTLPGPGLVEASGGCNLAPVVVTNLPLLLNCAMQVKKNAAGVTGGLITSNSLVNTFNRTDTAPTGSVWTAHVLGTATNTGGPGTVPELAPETPGLDFFTARTRDEVVTSSSPNCLKAGVAERQLAVRTANLSVAQPDLVTGQVPEAQGPAVGQLTVCYLYATNEGYKVASVATLQTATGTFEVKAKGECKSKATIASTALLAQACSLTVSSGAAKGGLVTSNGLIEKYKPASAANSGVWTFALFGAPPAA